MDSLKPVVVHLFKQMENLDQTKITVQEAHAHTGLARQLNNSVRHEFTRLKQVARGPGTPSSE